MNQKVPHKNTVWRNPRLRQDDNSIELFEQIRVHTVFSVGLLLIVLVPFGLMAFISRNDLDLFGWLCVSFLPALVVVFVCTFYFPPRYVRFHPHQSLAERGIRLLGVTVYRRWIDLSRDPLQVEMSQVQEKVKEREGHSQDLLGCLFF